MKTFMFVAAASMLASCMTMGGLDTNNDDRISQEEAAKSPELAAAFGVGDANNDGYLDPAEFETAKERLRETSRGQRWPHDDGH